MYQILHNFQHFTKLNLVLTFISKVWIEYNPKYSYQIWENGRLHPVLTFETSFDLVDQKFLVFLAQLFYQVNVITMNICLVTCVGAEYLPHSMAH